MRFVLAILLTATLSYLAGLRFEWWSIAIIAFAVALLIPQKLSLAFLSGLIGIFLLWTTIALCFDIPNHHILSHKISELFKLGGSSFLLIVITAIVGGLVGGFAAMAGSSLRPLPKVHRR